MKTPSLSSLWITALYFVTGATIVGLGGIWATEELRQDMVYLGIVLGGAGPLLYEWLSNLRCQTVLRELANLRGRDRDEFDKHIESLKEALDRLKFARADDKAARLVILEKQVDEVIKKIDIKLDQILQERSRDDVQSEKTSEPGQ